MQVVLGVKNIDIGAMRRNETALAVVTGGKFVRLWKRKGKVGVTVPLTFDELTEDERAAVAQSELGVGGVL